MCVKILKKSMHGLQSSAPENKIRMQDGRPAGGKKNVQFQGRYGLKIFNPIKFKKAE